MAKTYRVVLSRDNPNLLSMGIGGNQKLFESGEIRSWLAAQGIVRVGYSCNTRTNTVWTVTRYEGAGHGPTRAVRHFVFGNNRIAVLFKLKFG